jgi:hypothetical protein
MQKYLDEIEEDVPSDGLLSKHFKVFLDSCINFMNP